MKRKTKQRPRERQFFFLNGTALCCNSSLYPQIFYLYSDQYCHGSTKQKLPLPLSNGIVIIECGAGSWWRAGGKCYCWDIAPALLHLWLHNYSPQPMNCRRICTASLTTGNLCQIYVNDSLSTIDSNNVVERSHPHCSRLLVEHVPF